VKNNLYYQIELEVQKLELTSSTFLGDALALRRKAEASLEADTLELHQWRVLVEAIALQQARFAAKQPDGWRWQSTGARPPV
jgi:hypothetical protein